MKMCSVKKAVACWCRAARYRGKIVPQKGVSDVKRRKGLALIWAVPVGYIVRLFFSCAGGFVSESRALCGLLKFNPDHSVCEKQPLPGVWGGGGGYFCYERK